MEPNGRVSREEVKSGDFFEAAPLSLQGKTHNAKDTKILEACRVRDIELLRELAISTGGLVSDDVRRQACSWHREDREALGIMTDLLRVRAITPRMCASRNRY